MQMMGDAAKLKAAVGSALQQANAMAAVTDLVKEGGLWAKKLRNSILEFDRSLMDFVKSAFPSPACSSSALRKPCWVEGKIALGLPCCSPGHRITGRACIVFKDREHHHGRYITS